MPNIKSKIKRVKTNNKRRVFTASFKSSMKTAIKKVNAAVENKDLALASECLKEANKKLDKAQAKNIMHKNSVARKKSSLAQLVNTLK